MIFKNFLIVIALACSSSCFSLKDTKSDFRYFLPPLIESQVVPFLQDIVVSKKLSPLDITFVSSESFEYGSPKESFIEQKHIPNKVKMLNNINYYKKNHFDIWLLRQINYPKQGVNFSNAKHDVFAIAVDTREKERKSYYLQLDEKGQALSFKGICFSCHANGPRVIRPEKSNLVNISRDGFRKITKINQIVSRYGPLKTHVPNQGLIVPFQSYKKDRIFKYVSGHLNESLKARSCIGCHNGVMRSELLRQHRYSIDHLLNYGKNDKGYSSINASQDHMPLDRSISDRERDCILSWAFDFGKSSCSVNGDIIVANTMEKGTWLLGKESNVVIKLKTSVFNFKIEDISTFGKIKCDEKCSMKLNFDFFYASSQNMNRDKKILEIIKDNIVEVVVNNFDYKKSKTVVNIKIAGKSVNTKVPLSCYKKASGIFCELRKVPLKLSSFNIPEQSFLFVKLSDVIYVSGSFAFEKVEN